MKRFLLYLLLLVLLPLPAYARISNDPLVNQWSYSKVGAYKAWDISVGSKDVVVAIIDNGFDHFHPDLKDNVWINEDEILGNNIDDDGNGYIDDVYGWNFVAEDKNNDGIISADEAWGNNNPLPPTTDMDSNTKAGQILHHGTVVAGIIGAVGNNRRLGAGINWNVKLMNLRLIDNDGRGQTTSLGRAVRYAVDNGADVINFSIVSNDFSDDVQKAIDYAYNKGVVVVAAAGNNAMSLNDSPLYPICADTGLKNPRVLGVNAIQEDRRLAAFSNYGSDCIDLTAPGVNIGGLLRYSPEDGYTQQYSTGWSGTSFAAPFVSATAALIKAIRPEWTNTHIYQAILNSTDKTTPTDEEVYKNLFGRGLLQIDKALELAKKTTELSKEVKETDTSSEATVPINSVQKLRPDLHLVSLSQGLVRVKFLNKLGLGKTIQVANLKGADYVTQYRKNDNIYYAASRYIESSKAVKVEVFSESWEPLVNFSVEAAKGKSRIALADIAGDNMPEIILAPQGNSTELYRVYDTGGNVLQVINGDSLHQGGVVAHVPQAGKDEVVVSFQTAKETLIEHYNYAGELIRSFTTEQLEQPGSIIAADLEGDGGYEVIITADKSELSKIAFYRLADGQLLKSYPGYVNANVSLRMGVGDFNHDGADEILVSSADTTHPMRVWNKQLRRLLEIPILEQSLFSTHAFFVPSK